MITGLARLNGDPVGLVAHQALVKVGPYPAARVLNIDDARAPGKARRRLIHALEASMARRSKAPEPVMRAGVMP